MKLIRSHTLRSLRPSNSRVTCFWLLLAHGLGTLTTGAEYNYGAQVLVRAETCQKLQYTFVISNFSAHRSGNIHSPPNLWQNGRIIIFHVLTRTLHFYNVICKFHGEYIFNKWSFNSWWWDTAVSRLFIRPGSYPKPCIISVKSCCLIVLLLIVLNPLAGKNGAVPLLQLLYTG